MILINNAIRAWLNGRQVFEPVNYQTKASVELYCLSVGFADFSRGTP
jgi:hypothetical protein